MGTDLVPVYFFAQKSNSPEKALQFVNKIYNGLRFMNSFHFFSQTKKPFGNPKGF